MRFAACGPWFSIILLALLLGATPASAHSGGVTAKVSWAVQGQRLTFHVIPMDAFRMPIEGAQVAVAVDPQSGPPQQPIALPAGAAGDYQGAVPMPGGAFTCHLRATLPDGLYTASFSLEQQEWQLLHGLTVDLVHQEITRPAAGLSADTRFWLVVGGGSALVVMGAFLLLLRR